MKRLAKIDFLKAFRILDEKNMILRLQQFDESGSYLTFTKVDKNIMHQSKYGKIDQLIGEIRGKCKFTFSIEQFAKVINEIPMKEYISTLDLIRKGPKGILKELWQNFPIFLQKQKNPTHCIDGSILKKSSIQLFKYIC